MVGVDCSATSSRLLRVLRCFRLRRRGGRLRAEDAADADVSEALGRRSPSFF